MDPQEKFVLNDKYKKQTVWLMLLVLLFLLVGILFVNISISIHSDSNGSKKVDTTNTKSWRNDASGTPCPPWLACVIGFNQSCTQTDVCIGNLKCVGPSSDKMRCQCGNPDHQILNDNYTTQSNVCRGLIGSPCDPNNGRQLCADESAECVKVQSQSHRCECRKGYIENRNRGCDIAYGYACGHIRRINSTTPCDRVAELVCNKGMCDCKNEDDAYEGTRRKCSIPIGISCQEHGHCVENAFCKKVDPTSTLHLGKKWGRCTCTRNKPVDPKNPKLCTR